MLSCGGGIVVRDVERCAGGEALKDVEARVRQPFVKESSENFKGLIAQLQRVPSPRSGSIVRITAGATPPPCEALSIWMKVPDVEGFCALCSLG